MLAQSLSDDIVSYILSIPRFSKDKHSMEDLRRFLSRLGDPHIGKKIIHVAGTNGKGSVCAYLHGIFIASGIKTGLFTSPHLVSMRERIKINKHIATEDEFASAFTMVKENITDFHPTFFEFLFLMAMVIFGKKNVECIILETGLGGRLDATNVLENKDLTIITPISYDHMEVLGSTLREIANEKAGIMRPGIPLVTSWQQIGVWALLMDKASAYNSQIVVIDNNAIKINKIRIKSIDFSYQYRYDIVVRAILPTKALYQIENASLAIHSALIFNDERISVETIKRGLEKTVWPGRLEDMGSGVIFDGAHNKDGIRAFISEAIFNNCRGRKFLLFGGVKEKQTKEMITICKNAKIFTWMVACPVANPRTLKINDLLAFFRPEQVFDDVKSGLSYLLDHKEPEDIIFVTGSLYLYHEVKLLLEKKPRFTDD